jgi:hypothetical protein
MHAMHSARIPRSVGCLQASLWRSLVLQYTRDRDLRWTVTAHSTEVVLLSPRQSLRVLPHYDGAGASLRIQQPVAE